MIPGLRILAAGVAINTIAITNLDASTVAVKLDNVKSTLQAALVNACFLATVASATETTGATPTAIPIGGPDPP